MREEYIVNEQGKYLFYLNLIVLVLSRAYLLLHGKCKVKGAMIVYKVKVLIEFGKRIMIRLRCILLHPRGARKRNKSMVYFPLSGISFKGKTLRCIPDNGIGIRKWLESLSHTACQKLSIHQIYHYVYTMYFYSATNVETSNFTSLFDKEQIEKNKLIILYIQVVKSMLRHLLVNRYAPKEKCAPMA